MPGIPIHQIDAFTDRAFAGNPAAVNLLDEERDAVSMHAVAAEMNLLETAFIRPHDDDFELRRFTPAIEVVLSGHATLALSHALWTAGVVNDDQTFRFHTKRGLLTCAKRSEFIELDFPATPAQEVEPPARLFEALVFESALVCKSKCDILEVLESDRVVRSLSVDFARLGRFPVRGVIVSCPSGSPLFDFVSRFFAPGAGVGATPVCGSAHCCLAPFWGERLGKTEMTAFQASPRGWIVRIRVEDDRVNVGGQAVAVLWGEISGQAQP